MCNIGAVMHWCFDCINKSIYFILYICLRSVIWIGLDLENWTHVQLWPILHGTTIISIDVHLFNVFNLIYRPRKHCDDTISAILKFADDDTTYQFTIPCKSYQVTHQNSTNHFYRAMLRKARYCYGKSSVRPSVRLSVGPSVRDVEVS